MISAPPAPPPAQPAPVAPSSQANLAALLARLSTPVAEAARATIDAKSFGTAVQPTFGPADAQIALPSLGTPLPVFHVRLDALRGFHAGDDPVALLGQPGMVTWVSPDGAGYGTMVLAADPFDPHGKWGVVSSGGWSFAGRLRSSLAKSSHLVAPGEPAYLVQAPALNAWFVARGTPAGLVLTPVYDDASLHLSAGTALPIEDVFALLADAARLHDGNPR